MTPVQTFADCIRVRASSKQTSILRNVAFVIAGSLLVALCARIQLPAWPVPMTLQPFAVLLVGAALGSKRGALAILLYIFQGASGLPVFANPPFGGLAYFAGPTTGYLLGFLPAAYIVGLLAERKWDRRFLTTAAAMALGQITILVCGFAWMAAGLGVKAAFFIGVAPFIAGDVLKIALAAVALPGAWRILRSIEAGPTERV